jgi:hypothetical protein
MNRVEDSSAPTLGRMMAASSTDVVPTTKEILDAVCSVGGRDRIP